MMIDHGTFYRSLLLWLLLPAIAPAQANDQLIPLTDMDTARYQGYPGRLYPLGNDRPAEHEAAGLQMASRVQPLDTAGRPDPVNGKIVLLSIGMSNATQEFSAFMQLARRDSNRQKLNPHLVIVDGAQGGQTAEIIMHDTANFWRVIDGRLRSAGVTRNQVQGAWVKEADARPTEGFPDYPTKLCQELVVVTQVMKNRFPNLQLTYFSSRTYGGYATTQLNPEPYAYQSGFAVKWLLEIQLSGDTSLTFTGEDPRAPWMAWGPYLWANGTTPRSDGLIWEREDFVDDGTHPSTSGREKVAQMLWDFLVSDPTSRGWFLRSEALSVQDEWRRVEEMDLW